MARIAEIYHRNPDDSLYVPNQLETDNEVEVIIGMIKSIMLTTPGEVLGDPGYGIDLEGLVFSLNITENALLETIGKQLMVYCPYYRDPLYNINFKLGFFKGQARDACVIEFAIGRKPVLGIQVI
jgi:hypothetical protein